MQNIPTHDRRGGERHSAAGLRLWNGNAAALGAAFLGAFLVMTSAGGTHADVLVQEREPSDEVAPAAAPVPVPESRLTITANVPFDKAAAIANRYQLTTRASGTLAGFVSYDGVLLLGKIELGLSNEPAHPIHIEAPFSVRGTLGGNALDEAGRATIDMAVRIEENWCPIVEFGEVTVALDEPARAAAIAPAVPSFSDFVATQFLSGQLGKWATCDNIKEAINRFWHPLAFAVDTNSKIFLNIDPRSIGFSQFTTSGKNLKFVATIGGVSTIGSKATHTAVKPLPHVVPPPATEAPADLGISVKMNLGGL
jgi:hypothetical protein